MILDSTFLVDLERERRRGEPGRAMQFLKANGGTALAITFTIAGELVAGQSLGKDRAKWERFIEPFQFLDFSPEVGWCFGAVYRDLQARGVLIGANDMWIAATALANRLPVVTRNAGEFSRVTGLQVLGY